MPRNTEGQSKEAILQKAHQVWELSSKCWTQRKIAEHLGISQGSVWKYLKKLRKEYYKRHTDAVDTYVAQQVGVLDNIAYEAFDAWEKSKANKIIAKKKIVKSAKGSTGNNSKGSDNRDEIEQSTTDQYGDPRYLQVAIKASEDKRKLLGLDAAIKIDSRSELTGKNGEPIKVEHTGSESLERGMEAVASIFESARTKRDSEASGPDIAS